MQITPIKTRVFSENEDLLSFILEYVRSIKDGSVLVVTSKILALSEGRVFVHKNKKDIVDLIKKESSFALQTKHTWLTIKDGMVMASAGVDESNARGKIVLLPKDSFNSAALIRTQLCKKFKIKKLGVLITDSRLLPLRAGVVGVAIGYAGFRGIRNYVGKKDIFGRVLKMSRTDVADSLATAAVLSMGEGNERQPLAIIDNAPIFFTKTVNRKELLIDPKEDVYQPLFTSLKKNNFKTK